MQAEALEKAKALKAQLEKDISDTIRALSSSLRLPFLPILNN